MKTVFLFLAVLTAISAASDRSRLEFSLGAGAWMPALLDSDARLTPGPAVVASVQIPPSMGNVFIVETGFLSAGSDRITFDGVSAIPLTVGYRTYPFYRRFAGPRGIEPLMGIYAGGMLLWDSPEPGQDGTTTGAGVIGAEIGARVNLGRSASLDLVVTPEWIGSGSGLAGEGSDLTGLELTASISF